MARLNPPTCRPRMMRIQCLTVAFILWTPVTLHAAPVMTIDPGTPPSQITLAQDFIEQAKGFGASLLSHSDQGLLFHAERALQLASVLQPPLLILAEESPEDFPGHRKPEFGVLRLRPSTVVRSTFRSLQEAVCSSEPIEPEIALDHVIEAWLPAAMASVPNALEMPVSWTLAGHVAVPVIVVFVKAGGEHACDMASPYDTPF